jgi:hypothetical protein
MASALQTAINASIASGAHFLAAPPIGAYYFDSTPLIFAGARDFLFDGSGATFWFKLGAGILVTQCVNVTLRNLTIDYNPLPYFQASAISDAVPLPSQSLASPVHFSVNISTDLGSLDPDIFWDKYNPSRDLANEFVQGPQWWAPGTDGLFRAPAYANPFRAFNATRDIVPLPKPHTFTFTSSYAVTQLPRRGDKMSAIVRLGYTLHTHNSTRCRFSDISVHSTSYMGVTEFDGIGGHAYERVRVVRRAGLRSASDLCDTASGRSPRLCLAVVSCNADVFHSSGCRDGPSLRNVSFSYAMDDYLNVHSRAQLVAARISPTSLLVVDPRLARDDSVADDSPYGTVETMPNVRAGDVISFHAARSLRELGRAQVSSLRRTADPAHVAAALKVRDTLNGPVCGNESMSPQLNPISFLPSTHSPNRLWAVEFSGGLPAAVDHCALVNVLSWPNARASVLDSHFFGGIDGLRWKSSHGLMQGTLWENAYSNPSTGLEVTPLGSYLEGPLAIDNVTIRRNVFTQVPPPAAPGGSGAQFITRCKGMGHRANFTTCTNVVQVDNIFRPT